jgi:hypothetical protein
MIHVRNLKDGLLYGDNVFRVDRKTPLGNQWRVPPYTRTDAINYFREYLTEVLKQDTRERIYFERILVVARKQDITLMCHCWPLPCHADIIKEFLEQQLSEEKCKLL